MPFRILVVSDIHMFDGSPSVAAPSWVSSRPIYGSPAKNPLTALKEKFSHEDEIDWVLCPGDLADKNSETCQGVAWSMLEGIRQSLHARHLFGTVGNHDVDSRHVDARANLPTDSLRALVPSFPHGNASGDVFKNQFWANGIAQHVEADRDFSLTIMNSSEFHGIDSGHLVGGELVDQEWNRGKVSESAVDKLREICRRTTTSRNILMLHHHLNETTAMERDYSVLTNGSRIFEALDIGDQQWMVIHGHLHLPRLFEHTISRTISILSSGSAGGMTWKLRSGTTPDNQIHLIDFADGAEMKAQVHSWTWVPENGWVPASSAEHGLPSTTGFGSAQSPTTLKDSILRLLHGIGEMKWSEVLERLPDVGFLNPEQHLALCVELEGNSVEILHVRGSSTPRSIRRVD